MVLKHQAISTCNTDYAYLQDQFNKKMAALDLNALKIRKSLPRKKRRRLKGYTCLQCFWWFLKLVQIERNLLIWRGHLHH